MAALPLWGPGMVNTRGGGDSPFLLWRVHQLSANLSEGVLPARWMPDAAYGLGYPFFSYYAALPYYIASLLNLAGLDILIAIKLTQTLGFLFAAAASYGWFRRVFKSQAAAWLGAAAYSLAPFHLVNIYVRGDSLSEFYAFVFYPLILWAIDNVIERRTGFNILALGLAYGGLVVTHTLSAVVIFSPFVLLYTIFQITNFKFKIANSKFQISDSKFKISNYAALAAGLALGLALSAWYWLPLLETGNVQPGTLTAGYFHYGGHFRSLNLVQPSFGFVYDTTSTAASPFAMGLAQAVLAGMGIISYFIFQVSLACRPACPVTAGNGRQANSKHLPLLATFYFLITLSFLLLSTFMITPLSKPIWDHLPLLPMTQFPWRFLSVQSLFAAMATAFLVERIPRWRVGVASVAAAVLGVAALLPLNPDRLMVTAGDVTIEKLQLYELFTANIGTTITYEWLPRDVSPRPYTSELVMNPASPPRAFATQGELVSARELAHRATWRQWQVVAQTDATLIFPLYYWPGWQATLDGKSTAIQAAHSSGRVSLNVPPGQHTIVLALGRTPLRAIAEGISLLALLGCLGYWVLSVRHWVSGIRYWAGIRQSALYALPILLLLVIVLTQPPLPPGTLNETVDYIQMPYLHHDRPKFNSPQGYSVRLDDYQLSAQNILAGQAVQLTLNWASAAARPPLSATLSLATMSDHLPNLHAPIVLDQSTARLDAIDGATATTHILTAPSDLPTGVYQIQVRLADASGELAAKNASGTELGQIYLRPLYVQGRQHIGNEPILATFGNRIRLHAIQTEQLAPTLLLVKLDWSVAKAVAENYGIALRLCDERDDRWASIDTQPGYGFLPTTVWQPGDKITDRLLLPLPEGLPPGNGYKLEVILYDLANNLAGIGQHIQAGIELTQYTRRDPTLPNLAQITPDLALASLDSPTTHPQSAPVLTFNAGWLALADSRTDMWAHWWLVNEANDQIVARQINPLNTSAWPPDAFVLDAVHMRVPAGMEAGRYYLVVAMFDGTGEIGQARLEQTIEITGRKRNFDVPPLDKRLDVNLGGQVQLEGYTLSRDKDSLRLTLAWRALQAMPRDYTIFVHLTDANNAIPVQHDAMPLGNTYPTSWWAPGEVVSETITLLLKDIPPGDYSLTVGMYDAANSTRLQARSTNGQRLPDDRVVLPEKIRLR